eukprot:4685016-Amphidinium_carterae.6
MARTKATRVTKKGRQRHVERQRWQRQRPRQAQGWRTRRALRGYCGKCGAQKNCRTQVNAVEEEQQTAEVAPLSATEETVDPYRHTTVIVDDRRVEETPCRMMETPEATDVQRRETEDESLLSPIIVNDRQVEETPVAEVSTSDERYGVQHRTTQRKATHTLRRLGRG